MEEHYPTYSLDEEHILKELHNEQKKGSKERPAPERVKREWYYAQDKKAID